MLEELVNSRKLFLEIDMIVRIGRLYLIDRVLWSLNVESEVDTSSSESLHASIVICTIVDGVDTQRIDTELCTSTETAVQCLFLRLARRSTYSSMSRVQVSLLAIGSAASEEPPG